ncbi:hypothetical protein MJO28_010594 [Puccinia striiformis f. sp. tritici]|uniref:Uncharacterized protein n=2 Tax=Puccinia striiformis TaxID=27350 RepID=A0ACC0E723_9BASI
MNTTITQVINQILKDNQESGEKLRGKFRGRNDTTNTANISQFDKITLSTSKWQDIQELYWKLEFVNAEEFNAEIQSLLVSVRLTQEMESNHSLGAHIIPKYPELKEDLQKKINVAHGSNALYPI